MGEYLEQRVATRDPDDGKARISEWLRLDFLESDTGDDLVLSIPATAADPILLQNVVLIITTALDGGGTLDIGDGSDADAYVDNTDITEATINDVAQSVGSANAKAQGEYLVAARSITVTVGGAPTVGAATVLAQIIRL